MPKQKQNEIDFEIIWEFPLEIKEAAMTEDKKRLVKPRDGAPSILTTVFWKKFQPEFDRDWPKPGEG